jgi:GT2 family glycosyltransferase
MQNLVTIGILSYKDQKYLKHGLPALLAQTYKNIEILICDNNEDPSEEIKKWIQENFPTIKVLNAGGNVGFGKGHNHLIKNAKGDFYLCFNSDMIASPTYVEELLKPFSQDPKIAVVTGKLLQWSNFPESPFELKQNHIDTVGIQPYQSHFFSEVGNGQKDIGQFDTPKEIWGCSGASPMFKIELLKLIQHSEGEFFDANFFMYKEDIDLMYRLRWAGAKCFLQPSAVAWHDRTTADNSFKARKKRPVYIKENSFLNHLILLQKNWSTDYSLHTYLMTTIFLLKYTLYLLVFDYKVLKVIPKFYKLRHDILLKRQSMPRAIYAKQMEQWFN